MASPGIIPGSSCSSGVICCPKLRRYIYGIWKCTIPCSAPDSIQSIKLGDQFQAWSYDKVCPDAQSLIIESCTRVVGADIAGKTLEAIIYRNFI